MPQVVNHIGQLSRIADELGELNKASSIFGGMKNTTYTLLILELLALGFGLYHFIHDNSVLAATAFALEIFLIAFHAFGMSAERHLHEHHEGQIDRLKDELYEKEEYMYGVAEAYNIRVRRWYRRGRHFR